MTTTGAHGVKLPEGFSSREPELRRFALPRPAGILLHPTSLPGPYGIGDLGPAAHAFVDFLARAGQQRWQILPLNPTGFGDSPYASPSAFAGNPLLISPDLLVAQGLLTQDDLADAPCTSPDRVPFGPVREWKLAVLRRAFARFERQGSSEMKAALEEFARAQADWLEDYLLFTVIRERFNWAVWTQWPTDLRTRRPFALDQARRELAEELRFQRFLQFLFFRQWAELRQAANQRGIRIIGDVPIFVAHDSADVWAHQELFLLDRTGQPTVIAGVPPDYFSPTGQRWGNPLYNWERVAEEGYAWWIARMRAALALVDIVRIDHFRGFVAAWHVPAEEETAEHGRWVPGPGEALFAALRRAIDPLPIIVEDLGVITPDVDALRERLGYPGMKVLQFAFDSGPHNIFLPHTYERRCVVYTGTHDNDTTVGWYRSRNAAEKRRVRRYLGCNGRDISWDLMRLAWASVAETAIAPLQDVLALGSEARMNFPGRPSGNWGWRFRADALTEQHAERLRDLTETYGRLPLAADAEAPAVTSSPASVRQEGRERMRANHGA